MSGKNVFDLPPALANIFGKNIGQKMFFAAGASSAFAGQF
jgi:hypothetical protein